MSADTILSALADPTRRELLGRLAVRPVPAGELALGFPMSRPAIIKHLRVLEDARLVESHKTGRQHIYQLAPEGYREVQEVMAEVSAFWDKALAAFKAYAEGEHGGR